MSPAPLALRFRPLSRSSLSAGRPLLLPPGSWSDLPSRGSPLGQVPGGLHFSDGGDVAPGSQSYPLSPTSWARPLLLRRVAPPRAAVGPPTAGPALHLWLGRPVPLWAAGWPRAPLHLPAPSPLARHPFCAGLPVGNLPPPLLSPPPPRLPAAKVPPQSTPCSARAWGLSLHPLGPPVAVPLAVGPPTDPLPSGATVGVSTLGSSVS